MRPLPMRPLFSRWPMVTRRRRWEATVEARRVRVECVPATRVRVLGTATTGACRSTDCTTNAEVVITRGAGAGVLAGGFGEGVGLSTITCTIRADIGTIGRDIDTRAETTAPAWTASALTEVTPPAPETTAPRAVPGLNTKRILYPDGTVDTVRGVVPSHTATKVPDRAPCTAPRLPFPSESASRTSLRTASTLTSR